MQFTQINPYFFACDQEWDTMPEHGDGRLCEACDRVLIDFKGLREQEILNLQIANDFKLCGSYTKTQIDRIHRYHMLQESKKKIPWLVSLLMGGSLLAPTMSNAQSPFAIDSIITLSPSLPNCCLLHLPHQGNRRAADRESLSDSEIEEGYVLTCQSNPLTEKVVYSYDA